MQKTTCDESNNIQLLKNCICLYSINFSRHVLFINRHGKGAQKYNNVVRRKLRGVQKLNNRCLYYRSIGKRHSNNCKLDQTK